ncbi:hypothetical protein [Saccharomonospora iraqiensis]|uniref:hypothetical protein n=1 Tax=Saccharomonospora iraqiensis TaxID=52698 RepID=UPI00022E077E|nr:hypothetical protein [Saccharomonospora iraqiensis]
MLVTVGFLVVTAVLLAGLGRSVAVPYAAAPCPDPDVEPPFARAVARGLLVVWRAGGAHADELARRVDALSGRESPENPPELR